MGKENPRRSQFFRAASAAVSTPVPIFLKVLPNR